MKMTDSFKWLSKNDSIKGQLLRHLVIGLPVIWLFAIGFVAVPIFHETNKQNDIEMEQMADLLTNFPTITTGGNTPTSTIAADLIHDKDGDTGFAIWDNNGQLLTATKLGEQFPAPTAEGFIDSHPWWQSRAIRILYLQADNGQMVAVGRLWEERLQIIQTTVWAVFFALLFVIPLLIGFTLWAIHRGLRALKNLSHEVESRTADDLMPLKTHAPKELQPFTQSLNRLFARVNDSIEQEQRFTADAAHELRSPLAAIKAQSEVLMIAKAREKQLYHAHQIHTASERAAHLVDQLLTLSRLDPMTIAETGQDIDWQRLSDQALSSVHRLAREKQVRLKRYITVDNPTDILPLGGDEALLLLLLRNLLDNAIRYGAVNAEKKHVELTLSADIITIRDYGKGIAPENLTRIRERFFRPAGQSETGSGLGLSIVERIAELHKLSVTIANHQDGGVAAKICKINFFP